MLTLHVRSIASIVLGLSAVLMTACGPPNNPETAASPVQTVTRSTESLKGEYGASYSRRGDDGTMVAKVLAPAPAVWEALLAAMATRKVGLTILDRPAGRMGDTAMVLMRRWNGQAISYYLNCGSSMTGQRADEDRVRAVILAQISRMKSDSIAIAVHFSATSTSISGSSSMPAQCTSNGRGETELLDDVVRHLGEPTKR